jgi:hypothetical protein
MHKYMLRPFRSPKPIARKAIQIPKNNNHDDAEETIWLLNQRLSYMHVRGPSEVGSP